MNRTDLLQKTLILLNEHSSNMANEMRHLAQLNVVKQEVDFTELKTAHPTLEKLVQEHGLDLLLFAQNDQVLDKTDIGETIRVLRTGYSSFSGIDEAAYFAQTRQCWGDFIAGQAALDLPPGRSLQSTWQSGQTGFSLIFDTEQMGGVRFGLPRILDLLDRYQSPATFFVTGFVATIYPDLLPALKDRGHNIAVHGRYHEYLSDFNLLSQTQKLAAEKKAFEQHAKVRGANFIFRMNEDTLEALVEAGYDYFVVSMEHAYFPMTYRKMPVQPFQIWTPKGTIWMIPVSVESYNRPVTAVKLAANSAVNQARREQAPAINILMHPFRDGSLRHIGDLEKLIKHLQTRRSLVPVSIDQVLEHLPRPTPSIYIYVNLGDGEMIGYGDWPKNGLSNWQWHNFSKYWQRIGHLYTSLKQLGHSPALCLTCPEDAPVIAVYPYLPNTPSEIVPVNFDPITCHYTDSKLSSLLNQYAGDGAHKTIVFRPGSFGNNVKSMCLIMRPRQPSDWLGIFPEVAIRFIAQLTGYRHVF